MDIEAEYARAYGGAPRANQSWHAVLALLARTDRFENRELLRIINGRALTEPVPSAESKIRAMQLAAVERKANLPEDGG